MIHENVGLYSAHLPLDMHPVLGNNKALVDQIGLEEIKPFGEYEGQKIGFKGKLKPLSAEALGIKLEAKIGSSVKVIGSGEVKTLGLVSGGAADILRQAAAEGLDAYLTGEGSNHHFHEAIENDCVLLLAGHYATETGGVKAVGKHLEEQFGIQTEFLDYPTGM
jgi:putative NIF3 family GTP cyclohydrolase 1 type 2